MEDYERRPTPPPSATTNIILSTTPPHDPPPPYPSRERRSARSGTQRRRRRTITSPVAQGDDGEHLLIPTTGAEDDEHSPVGLDHVLDGDADESGNELDGLDGSSLLLHAPTSPSVAPHSPRIPSAPSAGSAIGRRPRTLSMTSTLHSVVSAAPSFAQTVLSAFRPDRDEDVDPECLEDVVHIRPDEEGVGMVFDIDIEDEQAPLIPDHTRFARRRSSSSWYKYFRPVFKRAYYSALFHLLLLNFPYALLAWVYLFVFTLTGTTTLMALPVGAILCFLDLIGARTFARGELALQTTFHGPLAYPDPSPPHPIFTRVRTPTPAEAETGLAMVYERSFYRNVYLMFTDSTSYQSLFYFLVIKPGITTLLFLALIVLVPVCFVLIFPAPALLRLVRRLGIWQANVAVEALWLVVR